MITHCLLDFNLHFTIPDELVWLLHIRPIKNQEVCSSILVSPGEPQCELSSFLQEQAQINQWPTKQISAVLNEKAATLTPPNDHEASPAKPASAGRPAETFCMVFIVPAKLLYYYYLTQRIPRNAFGNKQMNTFLLKIQIRLVRFDAEMSKQSKWLFRRF
jgi:hypothetical protein